MNLEPLSPTVDERGAFMEAFHLPHDGQVSVLTVNPAETRGNHYHERKTEHFLIVAGSAEFQVKDRESGNVMRVAVSGQNPMAVTISPNHTHNLTAGSEGCICIIWCDEQYDEADSDTFAEEI